MSGRVADGRRFGLLDAIVLVGASALGIVAARDLLVGDPGAARSLALAELALMLGSGSVLIARLRRPRLPLDLAACQPGTVACLLPIAAILAKDASWLVRSWAEGGPGEVGPIGEQIWVALELPDRRWACLVPIGWAALILARCWRPEPSWVDRAGRVLGYGWIAWGLAGVFLS